jgi:tetratricopeptide (TPR) repeat protein
MDDIQKIRNIATEKFATSQFNDGDILLAENANKLPNHVKLECLGNRHFYLGELQEAIRCYEQAISIDPNYILSHYQYLVGTQEEQQGNFVDAFKRYQMAIDSDPTFINAYVELGGLLVKIKEFKGALRCYQDAVRLNDSDPANFYNLKSILEKLAETEPLQYKEELNLAKQAYDSLVSQSPIAPPSEHKW